MFALLQHLQSYLGFSYLGCGVSLLSCSSKAQPLLLTLEEGYLPTAALPDLQRGIAPLGPPAPVQPRLPGRVNSQKELPNAPMPKAKGGGREEIPHAPSLRPGAAAGRSNPRPRPGTVAGKPKPTSKGPWLLGRKRA